MSLGSMLVGGVAAIVFIVTLVSFPLALVVSYIVPNALTIKQMNHYLDMEALMFAHGQVRKDYLAAMVFNWTGLITLAILLDAPVLLIGLGLLPLAVYGAKQVYRHRVQKYGSRSRSRAQQDISRNRLKNR